MPITWFDILAVAVVIGMSVRGWRAGGVMMLGRVASIIIGFVLTAYLASWINEHWLVGWSASHQVWSVVGFVALLLIIMKLLAIAVSILNSAFRIVSIIPLVGPLNSIIGALVGLANGVIIMLFVVYIFALFLTSLAQPSGVTYEYGLALMRNLSLFFPSIPL